jgi:hypothetical protein
VQHAEHATFSAEHLNEMLAGMPHCRICDQELLDSSSLPSICTGCVKALGLVPMPPPRRPAQPCAKCNGMKFIRAIPREYAADGIGSSTLIAPMALTAHPRVSKRGWLGGKEVSQPDLRRQSCGSLAIYACVGCGFLEWYCQDLESIPIGPEYMTDTIDYGGRTPYR